MNDKIEDVLICECTNAEHCVIIQAAEWDNGDRDVFLSIHLSPYLPWYKRIINAVRYIFGYRCSFGDFNEIILSKNHIVKLERVIEFLKKK